MKQYEPCPHCADDRAAGDLDRAQGCPVCKGQGMRRRADSFACNKCGGPLCPAGTMNADNPHGLVEAKVSGGYDSYHLLDGTVYEFSICEKCLREFFNACAIPPALSSYMGGDFESYAEERAAYERRLWRTSGGDVLKLVRGLCNVTIECENKATWRQFCSESLTERAMCDEHKRQVRFANSYEVRFEHVPTDIPLKVEERTPEQRKTVAWAWLRCAAVPGKPTYFQYVSGCVAAHVGRQSHAATKEESSGGVWFPDGNVPDWARELEQFPFDEGALAVGSYYDVLRLVKGAKAAGHPIVEAPILPHLHEVEGDEDPESV